MDLVLPVIIILLAIIIEDLVKNILPEYLRRLAWKRLSKLNLSKEIKEETFKGFICDCERQKSSLKKYSMMFRFIISVKNIEIPTKAKDRDH